MNSQNKKLKEEVLIMTNAINNNTIGFNDAFPAFRAAERMKAKGVQQIEFAEIILDIMKESEKAEMTATDIQTALIEKFGMSTYYLNMRNSQMNSFSIQKISAFLGKLQAMVLVTKRVVKTGEIITVKTRDGGIKEIEKTVSLFSLVG